MVILYFDRFLQYVTKCRTHDGAPLPEDLPNCSISSVDVLTGAIQNILI